MTPADLDAVRARIERAFRTAVSAEGRGYEQAYQATGTDFTTIFRAIGVKAPAQLEDELLNLFIWIWSLKDYLKAAFVAQGIPADLVEDEANGCRALMYVADIANRAKHGELRKSRSGEFAELVDVGHVVPQEAIERIVVAGPEVTIHVKNPEKVVLRATVRTGSGAAADALAILNEAMNCWETNVIPRVAT